MKKISLIISVYNEEAVLEKFFQAFSGMKHTIAWDYELIFVNDGSQDASLEILTNISQQDSKHIKVISFSRNFGHEAAMLAGIDYSTGDGLICMDADLQHPLEYIPQILEKFEEDYEVINMVRTANKSAGIIKNITSSMFYKVINYLSTNTTFEANASDFFAISKRVADILRTNYREKNRFLRGYVQNVGFRKTTIEYQADERAGGASHYSLKKLLSFSVNTLVCFSDMPLRLGIYIGALSAILGLAVLVYTLFTYHSAPSGYATIVILMCFLFAMLFLVVGIIGQYIAILFSETKDRPIYIVEKTCNINDREETNHARQ